MSRRPISDEELIAQFGAVWVDGVIATCRIGGRRIGDLLREAGVGEGGR